MRSRLLAIAKTIVFCAIPLGIAFVSLNMNLPWFVFLIGIVLFFLASILSVYLILAPENLFFTFVPENKVKFVVSGGKLKKILLSSNNYKLDHNYDVGAGKSVGMLGGLRFYGFWPISDILIYNFRWTNITTDGKISRHEKILDTMILKTDMYLVEVKEAEDKDLIPIDVRAVLTIRITNPYKAMYIAQDWLENVVNIIKPAIRNEIRKNSFLDLIQGNTKGTISKDFKETLGENIFEEAKNKGDIDELEKTYGVTLSAIRVEDINPESDSLRKITLKKIEAEKTAEVTVIEAEGIAEATIIKAKGEADAFSKKAVAWRNEGVEPKIGMTVEGLDKSSLNYTLLGGGAFDFLKDELKKK